MYAARIGNETVRISFDKRANQKARGRASLLRLPKVEFMDGDLRDLRLMDQLGGFDQIVCLETIKHIRNDGQLVADLSRLLKPGGRLFLTTPYKHYKHLLGDALSESEDGGHVRWGYTHTELRDLFSQTGLAVETQDYLSGVVAQQITNFYRLLGSLNLKIAWALTFPLRAFQVFDRPLTRLIGYPYLAVGVVGVKTREPRYPADSQP
jgi:SAM-dependent methyltransferase